MTSFSLRQVKLRPGEEHREALEIELPAFEFGGQRYIPVPEKVPAAVRDQPREHRDGLHARVRRPPARARATAASATPCSTCRMHAPRVPGRAPPDEPGDDQLATPYLENGNLDLSAWARDAVALALPDKILCRPDCAGLCPRVRQEPERRAARARAERRRLALGGARGAARADLASRARRRVTLSRSRKRRSWVTTTSVPVVGLERRLELLDRLEVEVVRRLVEDEAVHAAGREQRERGPRALARRERRRGPDDVVGAERELREQRARVDRRQPGSGDEAVEQRARAVEGRAGLVELAEDDRRPDPARAARERQPAEQRVDQRRLAGAVRPDDREPLAEAELEVERAEAERPALDDRAGELGDQAAAAVGARRATAAAATATTASRPPRAARGGAWPASPSSAAPACPRRLAMRARRRAPGSRRSTSSVE